MNAAVTASAIAEAESAARERPTDFTSLENLGSAYLEAGRQDEARIAFQRAIALNPGTAIAYIKIGWIHQQIGTIQQAVDAYEKAIVLDPHVLLSYEGLGWLYISKLADFERAIQAYERGLAVNPSNALLTSFLGSTYARMGQMGKALEILEQSAKKYPAQIYAPSWLSYLYFRLKRLDEAAASCRLEIEIKEGAHSPHRVLGFIYHLLGRNGDALAELERAVDLESHDYEARAALAKVYRENGDLAAAEVQYNTGRELSLEDREYGLACFHAVYGEAEKALDLLETASAKSQITPGWLRIDPELYFIQDEPRFQALIAK